MAKNKIIKALSLLFAFLLCISCLFACKSGNDKTVEEANVNVTVDGGSGSGLYKEGARCTVTAEEREGYRFVEWQVYGVTVSTDATYTFKVDFDIELKAVYEALPYNSYTVTVNGGRVGQDGSSVMKVKEGETVKIYPSESQARKFVKWIIDGDESTDNPYVLTVTKDVEISAVFEDYCMISVNGGTVSGERSKIVKKGEEVTVRAASDETKQFICWYMLDDNYQEIILSEDAKYTFALNDSMKIYAKFLSSFSVNVINGTASDNMVLEGEKVKLTPNESADPDKAFIGWYVNGNRVSLEKNYEIEIVADMEIEARYGDVSEVIKLPTPDSSANESYPTTGIIYREPNGAIAIDRLAGSATSMFASPTEYVRFDIYTSPDADPTQPIGSFKIRVTHGSATTNTIGWIETMDGTTSYKIVRGGSKNYYFDTNLSDFYNILNKAIGYSYAAGQSYYFAATSVMNSEVINPDTNTVTRYISSDRSAITTSPIIPNASASSEIFTINVVNGTIDGNKTSLSAGHGASVTVVANEFVNGDTNYVFSGWYEVSYDVFGNETVGTKVSTLTKYTFAASKNVTLKAIYVDEESLPRLSTPSVEDNKLIYKEAGGSWALDRSSSGSMFDSNVDYVIFYLYASPDADKNDYVGAFMMKVDINIPADGGNAIVGYVSLLDGTNVHSVVRGHPKNYWIVAANAGNLTSMMQAALGSNYSSGQSYYYACQKVSSNPAYRNSEISDISTAAIQF